MTTSLRIKSSIVALGVAAAVLVPASAQAVSFGSGYTPIPSPSHALYFECRPRFQGASATTCLRARLRTAIIARLG